MNYFTLRLQKKTLRKKKILPEYILSMFFGLAYFLMVKHK